MNKIKVFLSSLVGSLTLVPSLALAQASANIDVSTGFTGVLQSVKNIMDMIVPFLIGLAVIAFLWGMLRFVFAADNEDARAKGRDMMIWGIIGLVVMVSVWGLIFFVQRSFGLENSTPILVPNLPNL